MGFIRDKLPYRFYVIAGLRPDETEAAAIVRYARRGDGRGEAASETPVAMPQFDSRSG